MDDDLLNYTLYDFNNEDNFLIEKTKKSFWSSDEDKNQALFKKEKEFLQGYTDIPKQLINNVANRLVNTIDGLVISMSMPPPVTKALSQVKNVCPWHISISYDKNYLAILQDDSVVIVSKDLDYDFRSQKIIKIDTDPFPSWRTIAWSLDSSLIAISYSHGQIKIYRLSDAELIYVIQPKNQINESKKKSNSTNESEGKHILLNKNTFNQNNNSKIGIIDPAVSLQFIDPKRGKSTPTPYNGKLYSYELLVINHAGTLRSYLFNVNSTSIDNNQSNNNDLKKRISKPIVIAREGQSPDNNITFYHKFSFKPWLNIVVTSVVDLENNLLYLGGINKDSSAVDVNPNLDEVQKEKPVSNNSDDTSFIIWKLTSSLPFYVKYNSDEKSEYDDSTKKLKSARQSKWGIVKDYLFNWRHPTFVDNIIHSLSLSPNKEFLLTLDFAGTINLWRVKNEKLIKSITVDDLKPLIQNYTKNINKDTSGNNNNNDGYDDNITKVTPCDISWWSDSSIVISFNNGWVGVINLSTMNNIMGDQMELFNANPIVANIPGEKIIILSYSVKSKKVRIGVGSYIEEESEEESEEEDSLLIKVMESMVINPLSRITDTFLWHFDNKNSLIPKKEYVTLIERQYSLFILANTLPIDVFYHCISNLDFKGALDLAQKYDLDTDYVYQAQWLSSNVSEKTISDYLSKIKNNIWVIESCLDRIPSTPENLLLLIEYGLKLTNLKDEVLNDPLFKSNKIRSMSIDEFKKFDPENSKLDKKNEHINNLQISSIHSSHSFLSPRKKYALSHNSSLNDIASNNNSNSMTHPKSVLENEITSTSNNITDDFKQAVSLNEISSSSDSDDSLKPNYNCDICFYRLFLLKYLDRLKTYEEIMNLGNSPEMRQNFAMEFSKFRDINLVLQGMLFAVDEKFDELRVLFNRHTEELLPYRMNILEYIPEAVSPNSYEFLLPEIEFSSRYNISTETEDNSGEKLWSNSPWRSTTDWVEADNIKNTIQWEEDVPEDAEPFVNIKYNEYPAHTESITQWYIDRAHTIERNTGLINNALALIKIGIDKNVPNLETIYEDLITLSSLVYDCFTVDGNNVIDIDLETLEKLSEQEIVNLFMKETNSKRVVDDVRLYVIPYLERLVQRWRRNNVYNNPIDLLSNYLRRIAEDHIEWCCLIVEASHPVIPVEQRIIKYDILLSHLIVDCSYLNKEENNLQYIRRMFDCIPALDSDMYQDMNNVIQQEIEELDDTIDRFDDHLASLELLEKYDISLPLSWFNESVGNTDMQRALLLKLTRKISTDVDLSRMSLSEMNNPKNKKYQEWETLWDDILTLREYGVLDDIPIKEIQADFVSALLNGGQFALAKETIYDKDEGDYILPHSVIEKLIINASQEFFDNSQSGSLNHGSMMLARECLQIIDPTPLIKEELDLIDAVDILTQYKLKIKSKSDIPVLPIQVRMCENRLEFIQKILDLDTNDYTKTGKLIDLSKKLLGQKFNKIEEAKVRTMIGNSAIDHNNYSFANEICRSIIAIPDDISEANSEIWKLFYRLATNADYNDIATKIILIGHALSICPPEKISDILIFSRKLEAEQLLSSAINSTNINITDTESESILTHAYSVKKAVQTFEDDELYGKNCTTIVKHPFFNQSMESNDSSYTYGFYETSNDRSIYVTNNNANNKLFVKSFKHQILTNIFIRLEQIRKSGVIDNMLFNKNVLINNDDIRRLALDYFSNDSEMTIACLFDLNEDNEIDKFFNKIHPSIYREQFACYFFSLRCLYSWLSYENPDISIVLHRYHPKSIIAALNDITDIYENNKDEIDETNLITYNEALKAKHYATLLKEKRQEYIFQTFFNENFVNQEQFENDKIYRERTLENLICTTNSEKIENTLLLCGKYEIPTEKMMLHHIKWLFTAPSLKQSEIEKCLLSCREVIKYYPNDVINTFNELHGKLNGNNILKLNQFYKFYLQAYNNLVGSRDEHISSNIENRIRLLSSFYVMDTNVVFNIKDAIKALYSNTEDMKAFLTPLLTEKNITEIINLMPVVYELRAIPSFEDEKEYGDKEVIVMDKEEIKSMCYNSLILSMIQNEKGLIDGSLLTKAIPEIENLLSNLSYSDLLLFISNTTTGKDSKNLSIESRITLIDIALSYLQKENDNKAIDTISSMEDIHSHLELILLFKKLWDPNLKEYISHEWCEEFETIYNKPNEVPLNICSRMIVQGISPYLIYQTSLILQNRYKFISRESEDEQASEVFSLLNIYTTTLDTIIMTKEIYPLRALGLSSSEALFEDILDWVIYTTISYDVQGLEDKKWHEKLENGIFEYLKNVIANTETDNSLTNDKRRKLIEIFNRQFQTKISENTNITNILQSSKIQCIIRDNWNAEYSAEELNDETKYVNIIKYLLSNSQSMSHINAITEILNEWMFDNKKEGENIDNTKELSETLKECWKLFMLWMIENQYYQKFFYLRLKYIKFDLLGSKNEKEVLNYLKKNTNNYIYYLQNVLLTKENSQIDTVISEMLKILDAEKNGKKKVMKKKRKSLPPQSFDSFGSRSINSWNSSFNSHNNNNNNDNGNGWDVPLDLNIPLQEEPKSLINNNNNNNNYNNNTDNSNGWGIPSTTISKENVDGWDVPLDLNIPPLSVDETKQNETKPQDNVDGWDVPLDLNLPPLPVNEIKQNETKSQDNVDGWDVPLDLNLPPLPVNETKQNETKPQDNVDGWDVPLNLNIPPLPVNETKQNDPKPQDSVDGWDVPLDLNLPPLPVNETKQNDPKPQDSVDGWDVPLDLNIPPLPVNETKQSDPKPQDSVDGWDVPLDLNIPPLPVNEAKQSDLKPQDNVDGWDVSHDLNIPLPKSIPENKSEEQKTSDDVNVNGWDVPLDLNMPPLPANEIKQSDTKPQDSVNGWDVPLDLNIPSPVMIPESKTEETKTSDIPINDNVNGWDVSLDLSLPSPESKSIPEEQESKLISTEQDMESKIESKEEKEEKEEEKEEKELKSEDKKEENSVNNWGIPLDINSLTVPPIEATPLSTSPTPDNTNKDNDWGVQLDVSSIPMPPIETTQLSTSPKNDINELNVPQNSDIPTSEKQSLEDQQLKPETSKQEEIVVPDKEINESPIDKSVKINEQENKNNTSNYESFEIKDLTEEDKQIIASIKSDRNLHLLICSRGLTLQFIMSPLFGSLVQSVLTPISLIHQSPQSGNAQSMISSHKYSEYHHLLGYIIASLVSNGFINEASRLVYFYMNGTDSKDINERPEIHIGLLHRYRILKSYLKKTHSKICHRIKTQNKNHDDSTIFLRLNDQPQSIESAIIHEYINLEQIKEQLEKAMDYIQQIKF